MAPGILSEARCVVFVRIAFGLDVGTLLGSDNQHAYRAEVFVAVEQAVGREGEPAERFDCGAGVVDEAGAADGVAVGVERAAEVHRVFSTAGAEDQRAFLIDDGLRADVQPFARGDRAGLGEPADGFFAVVSKRGKEGSRVTTCAGRRGGERKKKNCCPNDARRVSGKRLCVPQKSSLTEIKME